MLNELIKGRGTQFDPNVVDVFLAILNEGTIDLEKLYPKQMQAADSKEQKQAADSKELKQADRNTATDSKPADRKE